MRKSLIVSTAATLPLVATTALAQVAPKGAGFKAEYLAELTVAEDHLVRLAEAIPADKYTRRPAAGVRSFSEVFLHVAGSKMPWFDGENTYRGILYFFTRHTGEHTGQLIAYARVNGITPPWSEGR